MEKTKPLQMNSSIVKNSLYSYLMYLNLGRYILQNIIMNTECYGALRIYNALIRKLQFCNIHEVRRIITLV